MDVVIEKSADRVLVRLVGRFDMKSTLTFRNAIKPLLGDSGVATVAVDFDQVPFMDSSALGMLLLLREQALGAKKNVVLNRCGPDLRRVLAVAQFDKMFRIE